MKKFINYLDIIAIKVGHFTTAKPRISLSVALVVSTLCVIDLTKSDRPILETELALPQSTILAKLEPPKPLTPNKAVKAAKPTQTASAKALAQPPQTEPGPREEMVTVKSGDSLALIFKRMNLSAKQLQNILALGNVTQPLKSMRPGKKIHFSFGAQDELLAIVYPIDTTTQLKITKIDGKFAAEQKKRSLETRVTYADATIQNSLYQAARRADLSDKQIMQLSKIFAWDIDFSRQIRSGDQVKVLYEEHFLDGKKVRNGNILAAIVNHRGKDYRAVYFEDSAGNSGFYSPDGKNLQKQFMRAPLKYVRISSPFTNKRLHPIHKVYRAHTGTDYAAVTGTPIRAGSDGVITYIGRKGGYGKMISIKHNEKYSTLYGHMSNYAAGLKKGSRVKHNPALFLSFYFPSSLTSTVLC